MLGDTPKRLEVDLASSSSMSWRREVPLDGETVLALQVFCRKEGVSLFVVAMSVLHQLMRAYSHQAYAIGIARDTRPRQFHDTVGMFVNTVLVPFSGGKAGGSETVQELHDRWTKEILLHATTPYDMVASMGYGCSVYLAFNLGMHENRIALMELRYWTRMAHH